MILYCYNTIDKNDYLRKELLLGVKLRTKLQVIFKKVSKEDKVRLKEKAWVWR